MAPAVAALVLVCVNALLRLHREGLGVLAPARRCALLAGVWTPPRTPRSLMSLYSLKSLD